MDFDHSKTARGFVRIHFSDHNNETCSLQESSRADDEKAVWLGATTLKVKVLDQGWHDVDLDALFPGKSVLGNERMHLTQSQVRALLPLLGHFARTGHLPEEPLPPAYHRLYRWWFAFGFPALAAMLGILWLMFNKPTF